MLEVLMKALRANGIKYDFDKIEKAYLIAEEAHKGQKRESGDDYVSHPVNVAVILSEYGSDTEAIVADVEQELQNSLRTEIESTELGEMVMDRLRRIDAVSYVRFASVYREFKDVDTFLEELNKIIRNGEP